MDRRTFLTAALALCASSCASAAPTTAPSKLPAKWWEGRDFTIDGHTATEWIWPKDRLIVLENPERTERIMIPVFDLRLVEGDERTQLAAAVRHYLEDSPKVPNPHVCLVRIDGYPTLVGIVICEKKPHACLDHYADALKRAEERLEKRKKSE